MRAGTISLAFAVGALVTACGPAPRTRTAFGTGATADPAVAMERVAAAVAQERSVAQPAALVVITARPPAHGLAVFSLPDGRRLWDTTQALDARPWILGDLVLSHQGSELIAFDARTGHERWRHPEYGLSLIGAASDGSHVVASLGIGGLEHPDGMELVVDAQRGTTQFEHASGHALGVPAIAAGFAFFPWSGQSLSIVDIAARTEVANVRNFEDFVSHAIHEGPALYLGGVRLYRLSRETLTGRRQGAETYGLPREDLPGRPHVVPSGFYAPYAGVNLRERAGIVARPDGTQPGVRLVDDTFYLQHHRLLFAFDATTGEGRWARVQPVAITGVLPVRGAVIVVDENGSLAWLDARAGNVIRRANLGMPNGQAVISAPVDIPHPADHPDAVQPAAETFAAAAAAMGDQLTAGRILAVRLLGTERGSAATQAIVHIVSNTANPEELRTAAGDLLATRTDGARAMIETLSTHYDYYRRTEVPPISYLARALGSARDRRAVAPLLSHLQDPYTPARELAPIADALRELGDRAALPALMDFVVTYHADDGPVPAVGQGAPTEDRTPADIEALHAALGAAAQAIVTLGGAPERARVRAMADDPTTAAPVRRVLIDAMRPRVPAPRTASASPPPAVEVPVVREAPLPPRATVPMINLAFGRVRERLERCFPHANPPAAIRVQFRYDGDGRILNAVVMPPALQACVEPIAREVQLPRTHVFREVRTFIVNRPAPPPRTRPAPAAGGAPRPPAPARPGATAPPAAAPRPAAAAPARPAATARSTP